MIVYEKNFEKLELILGSLCDILELGIGGHIKLRACGFMDLHVEVTSKNVISLTHYYEQAGDLIPDPDMQIEIYQDKKMIEALSYQDSFGYRSVYGYENGQKKTFDIRAKKDLNQFLGFWLGNLKLQGFKYKKE